MNERPLLPLDATFGGRTVYVTGHTGFKGAWLCEWLLLLGARVVGFSLAPPTTPALFDQLGLASRITHEIGDIRDSAAVDQSVERAQPEFFFHLAAQPLVRQSYGDPLETYAINVLGTAHLLDAIRRTNRPAVVVAVTTDKCYENREWVYGYREEDPLGGHDPYSSSKAAAELVIAAYRSSYFTNGTDVALASARAGNVIGGGDWAADRIVPDAMRALDKGQAIPVRNAAAMRPWQHVLESLSGYLTLAAAMAKAKAPADQERCRTLCTAFNFGPWLSSNRTVSNLVTEILKHTPGSWADRSDPDSPHEAGRLNLAIDKAFHRLGWRPVWNFEQSVAETVRWYRDAPREGFQAFTQSQIERYIRAASDARVAWAQPACTDV